MARQILAGERLGRQISPPESARDAGAVATDMVRHRRELCSPISSSPKVRRVRQWRRADFGCPTTHKTAVGAGEVGWLNTVTEPPATIAQRLHVLGEGIDLHAVDLAAGEGREEITLVVVECRYMPMPWQAKPLRNSSLPLAGRGSTYVKAHHDGEGHRGRPRRNVAGCDRND
jgi:hypothetical protein